MQVNAGALCATWLRITVTCGLFAPESASTSTSGPTEAQKGAETAARQVGSLWWSAPPKKMTIRRMRPSRAGMRRAPQRKWVAKISRRQSPSNKPHAFRDLPRITGLNLRHKVLVEEDRVMLPVGQVIDDHNPPHGVLRVLPNVDQWRSDPLPAN